MNQFDQFRSHSAGNKQVLRPVGLLIVLFFTSCLTSGQIEMEKTDKIKDEVSEIIVKKEDVDNQPYSSYWFPEELLRWDPTLDREAPFNRGSIKLAERIAGLKINQNARENVRITALSRMNMTTGNNFSQGGHWFSVFAFHYWQYIDKLVMWGGSAGEGLILSPSSDVIDSAHRNGVPVLGTVFFPPLEYGGNFNWVREFLKKNGDGSFPMADKLLEVAEYYRFDGWFINQETAGGSPAEAELMIEFMKYLQRKKDSHIHIMWYDAMTENGDIDWQNALTEDNDRFFQDGEERVSDSMFLNFWWQDQTASAGAAEKLNRSPMDLYAGVDVQAAGFDTPVPWTGIFPENETANTSLAFYCPGWTYHNARDKQSDFYRRANRFWVGDNGNPARTEENREEWKGLAHYAVASTPIKTLPFITHFNTGNGKSFSVNGEVISRNSWNYRSLQDIPPTWQWIVEGDDLKLSYDWKTAYYGGSSLKIEGDLSREKETLIKLYKTDLNIEEDSRLELFFRTSQRETEVRPAFAFEENPDEFITIEPYESSSATWNRESFSLAAFQGRKIVALGLLIESSAEVENALLNIGRLAVFNGKNRGISVPVLSTIEGELIANGSQTPDAGLYWEPDEKALYYEVYQVMNGERREYLKSTPSNALYLAELEKDSDGKVILEIEIVDKWFNRGNPGKLELVEED